MQGRLAGLDAVHRDLVLGQNFSDPLQVVDLLPAAGPPQVGVQVVGSQRVGPFDAKTDASESIIESPESVSGKAAGLAVALDHAQDDVHVVDADLFQEPEVGVVLALHPVGVDAGSDADSRPVRGCFFVFRARL